MGKQVTFLHAADVHYGAPMRGLLRPTDDWSARLMRAIPDSFDRLVETAIARSVDFVVLAGDTLDTSRLSYAEQLRFLASLSRLDEAGIPTYIVAGNHDPHTVWSREIDQLPASVRLLGAEGPEFAVFERDGQPVAVIVGRSYYNQAWPADRGIADGITARDAATAVRSTVGAATGAKGPFNADEPALSDVFTIAVIHTGLDIDAAKAPADARDLIGRGIDYWACGHVHERRVLPSEDNPRIVYPGCIQGRDTRETGERGCFLVTLEQDCPPALEFVSTSSVIFERFAVNVSVCPTLGDLVHLVASTLFRENSRLHCDEMVVRIALEGATELHRYLAKSEVIEELRKQVNDAYPSFYCDALVDCTTDSDTGAAAHREGATFVGIVADIAGEQREREEAMVNYVQSEFVKRGIAVPESLSRQIGAFAASAETRVFDMLREGEGETE